MSDKIKVGMQFSVGRLGDKSFNDSAFAGLEEAKRLYDITIESVEWRNTEVFEQWAKAGFDLIIGVGYLNVDPINATAARFPESRFALIDVAGKGENVWSATYREYEGDFVVGALAAMITENARVGFMGGGITPVVRRIESGFSEGVKYIDPEISIVSDYVGEFADERKGQILAETQYAQGADVLYQVAGRCGLGAIKAAEKFDAWIISTGGDHSHLAPKNVLTSRIKDVGRPVKEAIEAVIEDRFEGGVKSYGFAEGGLRMAPVRPDVYDVVTPKIQGKIQELQAKIISRQLQVNLDEWER